MSDPAPNVLPIPVPSRGPSSRLELSDPATLIMIMTWVGEAAKAIQDAIAGHTGTAGILSAVATIAVTAVVLLSKHLQQAQTITAVIAAVPEAAIPGPVPSGLPGSSTTGV